MTIRKTPSLLLLLVFFLASGSLRAQKEITWKTFASVSFESKYSEELMSNFWFPSFSDEVKTLEGQQVTIKGYLIVMDLEAKFLVLSANPYASCFFCGNAGPESVLEVRAVKKSGNLRTDQVVWATGILKLNADDINEMNFILEEAMLTAEKP